MFKTIDAKILICGLEQIEVISPLVSKIICLDEAMKHDLRNCECNPPRYLGRSQPQDAAYVVMTSGTTGNPKGTVLEHSQVSSGFQAQVQKGLFRPGWRMLRFASYSFDPCIADMIGPLLVGGCVCIPKDADKLTELPAIINDFKIDIVELTPSVANLLDPSVVPNLKVLRFGGEEVTAAHIRHWTNNGNIHIENSYGPSECCITCSVTPRISGREDPANFGSAMGCHMWVVDVDDRTKLAPLSQVGELAIQGPIVGRRYINDPAANSRAFLTCPPWLENQESSPMTRVYMTGDLVHYDSDGSLIFVGRRDHQIKLHGQRIELREIESVAMRLEYINEAICFLTKLPGCSDQDLAFGFSMVSPAQQQTKNSLVILIDAQAMNGGVSMLRKLDKLFEGRLPAYMKP
ncbi:acetyl-CoA synthetase-like protein [Penicillium longicatenatum]|nr:acetyl-CoA synthetase-like protein [Penicillium longicatenatum]